MGMGSANDATGDDGGIASVISLQDSQRASKDSIIVSDGQPIKDSGCVNLSMIIVMEISKVTRISMVRSMLIVVQFSDGVTSVFQVSVLVDLKPVVVISKVLAGVETGQVEFHGQWSVSPLAHFNAAVDSVVEGAGHEGIRFHLTLGIVHGVSVVRVFII
mmetsp:Transcript_33033/g.52991  ORF Transcript_33033/g.52991 Transcript_33033/m.52991 type:complete len:160 (-) Transcript_33033:163-642(-)